MWNALMCICETGVATEYEIRGVESELVTMAFVEDDEKR